MKVIEEINATTGQVQVIEDFQGPIGARYLVKVSGDGWRIQRWFFFDEFDKKEAKMFGVKSLNNPNFRQECISGTATWAQIQELYIEAEQTIVSIFEDYSVFEYAPSDFEGEKRAEWAEYKLMKILKETHESISRVLQETSLTPEQLEPYLETQIDAVQGIAAMIDPKSSANLGDVRPIERFVEYRGSGDQKWVLSDSKLDLITIIDAYTDQYGPTAAIRSSPDKASAIRNLDWNRTHRTWNSDREVWEIDLSSIEYSIDKFTDQNYTVRVSELMVRLAGLDAPERPYPVRPSWKLPTLKLNSYEKQPSATSLLLIPGIGPSKAQSLLVEGFTSIPEIAHASVSEISETDGFGEIFSQIAKYGAEAAVGQREPAAVIVTKKTTLSIPDAQKRIVALANRGVPQTEAIPTLIDVYNTDLPEMESILEGKLYSLYTEGYHSIEDVADSKVSDLTKFKYIDKSQAKKIRDEAIELTS